LPLSQGRLEQAPIAYPIGAAIAGELKRVQFEHVLEVEELGNLARHLASFLSVSS
jgi:hypothetical protein